MSSAGGMGSVLSVISVIMVGSIGADDACGMGSILMDFLEDLVDLAGLAVLANLVVLVELVALVDLAVLVDLADDFLVEVLEVAFVLETEPVVILAFLVLSPSIDLLLSIVYNYNMKAVKLTKKQLAVLDYLQEFTEEKGYSPSYREIQAGLGLSSVSAVAEHVDNLVAKGALRKVPGAARSLEILDYKHAETVELFKVRMIDCTDEEREVLKKAAEILGLDLE